MAYKMQLRSPVGGVDFIWNISGDVGDNASCRNDPMDVNLIKVLMAGLIANNAQGRLSFIHPSCRRSIDVNGQMDQNLAYFIRLLNAGSNRTLALAEAGKISPAQPSGHYGSHTFSIVFMNSQMAGHNRSEWASIGQRYPSLAGIETRTS